MIKRELLELNAVLLDIANFGNTKFKYAVLKNIEVLKLNIGVLKNLESSIKKHLTSFEEGRDVIILKIGTKREDGSTFIDTADRDQVELFNIEYKILLETYATDLQIFNDKISDFQELLKESVEEEFVFKQIPLDLLPDEGISSKQLETLVKHNIIKE